MKVIHPLGMVNNNPPENVFIAVDESEKQYGLASIVFADDTALSPNACVRISWEIMRRRKMELFCLNLSFIGWDLLISFASMMIMGMFGTVIGNTVSMMASLLLSIYVSAAQVCFFLAYSGKLSHEAQAADHGEDDPLN